jgi:hypothetical protein
MLKFLYDMGYHPPRASDFSDNPLLVHLAVYVIADKYRLESLKNPAVHSMTRILSKVKWPNTLDDSSSFQAFEYGSSDSDSSFSIYVNPAQALSALSALLDVTPVSDKFISGAFAAWCEAHFTKLRAYKEFKEILGQYPEFAIMIMEHSKSQTDTIRMHRDDRRAGTDNTARHSVCDDHPGRITGPGGTPVARGRGGGGTVAA